VLLRKQFKKKNLDIVNYVKLYDLLEITAKGLKNSSLDLKKKMKKISQQIEKIKKKNYYRKNWNKFF